MAKSPLGREEVYARELNKQLYERGVEVAAVLQTPPQSQKVSDQKEYEMYWTEDPKVDVVVLMQQGASAEEATLAKYPYRSMLLTSEKPKLVQRVAYANKMKKKHDMEMEKNRQDLVDQPSTPALDHIARNLPNPDDLPGYERGLHDDPATPPFEAPTTEPEPVEDDKTKISKLMTVGNEE